MPTFQFQNPRTGEVIERYYHMSEAPPYGHRIRVNGSNFVRIVEKRSSHVDRARADLHFTSHQLEDWAPGAPRYDAEGRAQFQSRREVDEFVARSKDTKHGGFEYDGL